MIVLGRRRPRAPRRGSRPLGCLAGAVVLGFALPVSTAPSNSFDIGGNGPATIAGGLGATVTSNPGVLDDLVVAINFGEVSPANRNSIVRARVPVALRSSSPYQLTVALTATVSGDPNAVQLSDVGFGVQNFASLGGNGTTCGASSVIASPFNNDPALTANRTARASYPSSLATVGLGVPKVLINGPKLSKGSINPRQKYNGYGFDAILTMVPQFYTTGSFQVTLTFRVSPGPVFPCPHN